MAKTENQDRRTRRTERNLREALHSLILEKGYDTVTVQNITDRADVGRSTFYAHFENKDKLHLSAFDEVFAAILLSSDKGDKDSKFGEYFNFNSLRLFQHAAEKCRIYQKLAGRDAGKLFLKNMFRRMHDTFLQDLKNSLPVDRKDSFEAEAGAHFFVSTLISMLTFWLEKNLPLSPEEMNELFRRLVMPGLDDLYQLNLNELPD